MKIALFLKSIALAEISIQNFVSVQPAALNRVLTVVRVKR